MKRQCLLDSSFLIDLLNEATSNRVGPAARWLQRNRDVELWISAVTFAEVMEGADDLDVVRTHLQRFRWQGLHRAHAEIVALKQRHAKQRMGENDAWQMAVAIHMKGFIVGNDPKAFSRLGDAYIDHRA